MFTDASSYVLDTWQRSVLFLDVMRQRAIQYRERAAESARARSRHRRLQGRQRDRRCDEGRPSLLPRWVVSP